MVYYFRAYPMYYSDYNIDFYIQLINAISGNKTLTDYMQPDAVGAGHARDFSYMQPDVVGAGHARDFSPAGFHSRAWPAPTGGKQS